MKSRSRHRRKAWRFAVLSFIGLLVLGMGVLTYATYDPSPVGHFLSETGQRAYSESYTAAMGALPEPEQSLDLDTEFGSVRVYKFSSPRAQPGTPVVMLPGWAAGVPMWEANLPELAEHRTVYAFDALGQAGMSVQTREIRDARDQAVWVEQTLAQLELPKVHLVGHSFGGWSAANYAARYPERVASLSLLEPVFVFQGLRWQVYVKSLPASLPFLPERWRNAMLQDFGGVEEIDPDDPVARMISDATKYYAAKLPLPERPSEKQLQGLAMPVYVALAAESYMHDALAAAEVARENVRDLRLRVWPEATHSLPMEAPEQLNRALLAFMEAHDETSKGVADRGAASNLWGRAYALFLP